MDEYIPSRNDKCLCGSGKNFHDCCASTYDVERPITAGYTAFNGGDYVKALKIFRADITRYVIWHKKHTIRLVNDSGRDQNPQWLLDVDIRALSDLVMQLLHCYEATNRLHKFHSVLNRLKDSIVDPRWAQRIVYFHALTALGRDLDENAAREVLKQLEPIIEVGDGEILQLYLDLNGDNLTFSKKIQIIDRVIILAETPVDRLQYRGLKGVELFLIGDIEGSTVELEQAIGEFQEEHKGLLTVYENFRLGMNLDFLGSIKKDPKLFDEALKHFQAALVDENINNKGRADLHRYIAETWVHIEDWQKAKDSYLRSLDYDDSASVRVLLAECLIGLDDISRAIEFLESVDTTCLDTATKADYAFVSAAIVIAKNDTKRAFQASELLKDLELPYPYFRERRDSFLLAIRSLENHSLTQNDIVGVKRTLFDVIRFLNRYIMIQPNVAGMGLDLNKAVEDLVGADKQKNDER